MSSFMKIMQWRVPAVLHHQRWIARQSRPVRFAIGFVGFCLVPAALERWLEHGSALDHIVGMIGGAVGCATAISWGQPREG